MFCAAVHLGGLHRRQERQCLFCVVLGDALHERPVGEVTVEETQWTGHQRQTHREHIEVDPLRIETGPGQSCVPLAEAELEEDVLPFDVEVHQALDVDQDGVPVGVCQDVVGSEFSVDQSVFRARTHPIGQFL